MVKLIFKKISLKKNIEIISSLYFNNSDKLMLLEYFPEMEDINCNMLKKDIQSQIEAIVTNYYNMYNNNLTRELERYKINAKPMSFINELVDYFNIKNNINIYIYLGVLPVISYDNEKNHIFLMPGMAIDELNSNLLLNIYNIIWFNKIKGLINDKYDYHSKLYNYTNDVKKVVLNNKIFNKYHLVSPEIMHSLAKIFNCNMDINQKIINSYQEYQNKEKNK